MKKINLDDYLNELIKRSGLSKDEVLQLARKKKEAFNYLNSEEVALFVVGRELGIDFPIADIILIKFYFADDLKIINRDETIKRVVSMGGIVRDEITNDLWYLVTSDPNKKTKEFEKAKNLGVTFIDELDFIKMIENEIPFS